jgi:hypothetical protein
LREPDSLLPRDRTGNVGENVVGIRADQANCAYNDHKDNREHHSVFRNILSFVLAPQSQKMLHVPRLLERNELIRPLLQKQNLKANSLWGT